MGMSMPGWYDIVRDTIYVSGCLGAILRAHSSTQASFEDAESRSDDESGILKTRDYLRSLLQTEADETGVPPSRMIVGM